MAYRSLALVTFEFPDNSLAVGEIPGIWVSVRKSKRVHGCIYVPNNLVSVTCVTVSVAVEHPLLLSSVVGSDFVLHVLFHYQHHNA